MKEFIEFILNEFMDEVPTDTYYTKYENMSVEDLYFYFKR